MRLHPGFAIVCLFLATLLPGCASLGKKKETKPVAKATAVPKPVFIGTVALVNGEQHFVLIDNGPLAAPPPDFKLKTYTAGKESGELVTSQARRRPFIIADIKKGEPLKGDRVYTVPEGGAPPPVPTAPMPVPPRHIDPEQPTAPDFLPPVQLAPSLDQ